MIFKLGKSDKKAAEPEPTFDAAPQGEPSYIARDASLEGNINSEGEIHIDGELRGHVRAHTCLVDRHGEVIGGISAQFVVVRGRVLGPINATQVTIQSGAHVEGNVVHEGLSIENGAFVMGSITQSNISDGSRLAPLSGYNAEGFTPSALPEEPKLDTEPSDVNVLPLKIRS